MKSTKTNKDLNNSASAPYFSPSSQLYRDENPKYFDKKPQNQIKSQLAWKIQNNPRNNDEAFEILPQNKNLYQRNDIELRSSQTQSTKNSYLLTQNKGQIGNFSYRRESDLNEIKNQAATESEIQSFKEELQEKKNLLDQTKKNNKEKVFNALKKRIINWKFYKSY